MSNTENNKEFFAFIGVFLSILGVMLIYSTRSQDKYAMHYAKQSLMLSIFAFCVLLVSLMINTTQAIVVDILLIICISVWFKLIFDSCSGEEKEFPFINNIAKGMKI